MPVVKLIADSGATKAEWCLLKNGRKRTIFTQGISPYFLNTDQIHELLEAELKPRLRKEEIQEVYYYGTGCANPDNARSVKKAISRSFKTAKVEVTHDLMGLPAHFADKIKEWPVYWVPVRIPVFIMERKLSRTVRVSDMYWEMKGVALILAKK